MIDFKRNLKTGILEAWKDGKKIGSIRTLGEDDEATAKLLSIKPQL